MIVMTFLGTSDPAICMSYFTGLGTKLIVILELSHWKLTERSLP